MYSKSSTFLALSSILAILAVLSIAINNLENGPVRRPFPASASNLFESSNKAPVGANPEKTLPVKPQNQVVLGQNGAVSFGLDKKVLKDLQNKQIVKNINNDLLRAIGLKSFFIKTKPFDGQLFDRFDLTVLIPLNILRKSVVQIDGGNEKEILDSYEFNLENSDTASEAFEAIKSKIKSELGYSINQTNQFGMASFFINSNLPEKSAFLIVKTKLNVYALSYPRASGDANDQNKVYFELVSRLLKELN